MNVIKIISALNLSGNLEKQSTHLDYVILGNNVNTNAILFEKNKSLIDSIEASPRRDVDIQAVLEQKAKECINLHIMNSRDPTFSAVFSGLPENIIQLLIRHDKDPSKVTLHPSVFKEAQVTSFYDAFLMSFSKEWRHLEQSCRKRIIEEFKQCLWQHCVNERLYSKNSYSSLFTYDELDTSLSAGTGVTSANVALLQDIYKLNIITVYEDNIRFQPTKQSRLFFPFLIFISREDTYCSITNDLGDNESPFLLRNSSDASLIKDLMTSSNRVVPTQRQDIGVNLSTHAVDFVREIASLVGVDTMSDGRHRVKADLITEIYEHRFTDDEINSLSAFLTKKQKSGLLSHAPRT